VVYHILSSTLLAGPSKCTKGNTALEGYFEMTCIEVLERKYTTRWLAVQTYPSCQKIPCSLSGRPLLEFPVQVEDLLRALLDY
jgi:hypothetical protein